MGNPGAKRQPSPVPRGRNSASTPFPAQEPNAVARNLEIHLRGLADEILLLASGDGVAIALAENGELRCRASSGIAPPPGARIDARSGLTGACLNTGTLLRCDDSETDARVDRQVCRALGIRAIVCVPVMAGQEVVGIFEIFSSRPSVFANVEVGRLQAKGEEIADAFTAEEALLRASVASTADLGTAGDLASSWTPALRPAPARRRLPLSAKSWQALLGALVLGLGIFLFVRAIGASGPSASAWSRPQSAAAAPSPVASNMASNQLAESRHSSPRRSYLRGRAQTQVAAEQILIVKPAPVSVATGAAPESGAPAPPSTLLIASGASDSNPLHELISSIPAAQPAPSEQARVSSGAPEPVLLRRVVPEYPPLAKEGRIEGDVVLEARVSKNGQLTQMRVDSGNSLLAESALRAVNQWRYRPARLNGVPVEAPIKIVLKFELGK